MKYHWESQDITMGRKVDAHNRSERYMIGWDAAKNSEDGNILLVSLKDGMVSHMGHSKDQMAELLNKAGMRAVSIDENDIQGEAA